MQCPSCKARIGDTSNFCRYCGIRVFQRPPAAVSKEGNSLPFKVELTPSRTSPASAGAGAFPTRAAAAARKATDVTIRLTPGFYPIPKRFELLLKSGAKPEGILGEVLRQKAEMRNLLERIAGNGHVPADAAEAAKQFLLSHCIVCGDSVNPVEAGRTPLCRECASLA